MLLLALLFGFALARIGEHGRPVMNLLNEIARVMFGIVWFITRLAPIGAFGAMAFTIGKFGIGSLVSLGQLLLTVYITCALFIVLVLGGVARAAGFRFWKVIRHIKEEIFIQLGTSSSEAAMPGLMEKLERVAAPSPSWASSCRLATRSISTARASTSRAPRFSSRKRPIRR